MKACDIRRRPSRTSFPLSLSPPLMLIFFSFISFSSFISPARSSLRRHVSPPYALHYLCVCVCVSPDSLSRPCPLLFHYNHCDGSNVKKWKSHGLFPLPVSFCHWGLWSLTHSSLQLCLLMVLLSTNAFTRMLQVQRYKLCDFIFLLEFWFYCLIL